MSPTYHAIGWAQFENDTQALVDRIRKLPAFDRIVAITRGGMVPAAIIASQLDIRIIDTVGIEAYRGTTPLPPKLVKPIGASAGDRVLIVDDLVDSGATARMVRRTLPTGLLAVVYAKPAGRNAADMHAVDVPQDRWLVFPWEKK